MAMENIFETDYGNLVFSLYPDIARTKITVMLGYSKLFSIAIFFAAIQIHHFFVDGVIWKLKNKTVSHPLMMSVDDITGGRGSPVAKAVTA